MKTETFLLLEKEEYSYPSFGFVPNIHTYLHEDGVTRPAVIVVPGGGYFLVSPTEGEIVAKKFFEMGYQTFVVTYTTNVLRNQPLKDQPLKELSRAIRFVRRHAEEFLVDPENIFLCGFSAGAHLCGSVAVHWMDVNDENPAYAEISNKPTGVILSYPVITSGKYAHEDSFVELLGEDAAEDEMTYMSLEKQVSENTPPVFLWQTAADELVPVENSYLMAAALKKAGILYEHHVFPEGEHGLSLSNKDWEDRIFGEPYPYEQLERVLAALQNGSAEAPEELKNRLLELVGEFDENAPEELKPAKRHANAQVEIWPVLANAFLQEIMKKQTS